jgi:hypothetical protein
MTEQTVPELSIPMDDLMELIVRVRGVQAKEGEVDPDSGSNATDDNNVDALQETPGDGTRAEIFNVIRDYDPAQQAELVALFWIGRGDAEPEEWDATVALAADRRETPSERYLLKQPLVAEFWLEGLERLGIETALGDADPQTSMRVGV